MTVSFVRSDDDDPLAVLPDDRRDPPTTDVTG
jgi:hypothetical protein